MKTLIKLTLVLFICGSCIIQPVYANSITETTVISNNSTVSRADKIVWKYKVINGTPYKRQYNVIQKKWIGSWVKV